jgi:hypothetical protein
MIVQLLESIGLAVFDIRPQKAGMNMNDLFGALFGGGGASGSNGANRITRPSQQGQMDID